MRIERILATRGREPACALWLSSPTRQRGTERSEACRQDASRSASVCQSERLTLPQNAQSVRPR